MKKTNETLQTAVLLLLAAVLIVIFWQMVKPPAGVAGAGAAVPTVAAPETLPIIYVIPATPTGAGWQPDTGGAALVAPFHVPADTTDQAAAVYAASPDAVNDCMRAAVEGRRSTPACQQILTALGSGR